MNLKLVRKEFKLYGIFGELWAENGLQVAVTLEHSYSMIPKLPPGEFVCVRGIHHLKTRQLETFEVTDVPGHTGILFHSGNVNSDSEGCVLLGMSLGTNCILDSHEAFQRFMDLQKGLESFTLTVEDVSDES